MIKKGSNRKKREKRRKVRKYQQDWKIRSNFSIWHFLMVLMSRLDCMQIRFFLLCVLLITRILNWFWNWFFPAIKKLSYFEFPCSQDTSKNKWTSPLKRSLHNLLQHLFFFNDVKKLCQPIKQRPSNKNKKKKVESRSAVGRYFEPSQFVSVLSQFWHEKGGRDLICLMSGLVFTSLWLKEQ